MAKKKALLMKCALGTLFWCFLKKHKACLGAFFYFIAKKIWIIKINCLIMKKWHGPMIYYTNTILKVYYTNIYLFTCQKIRTKLIYYSCALWSLILRCWLNHIHHLIITIIIMYSYETWELYKMLCLNFLQLDYFDIVHW